MRRITIRPDSPSLDSARGKQTSVQADWTKKDQQMLEALQSRQVRVQENRQRELRMLLPSADDATVSAMLSKWDNLKTLFGQ